MRSADIAGGEILLLTSTRHLDWKRRNARPVQAVKVLEGTAQDYRTGYVWTQRERIAAEYGLTRPTDQIQPRGNGVLVMCRDVDPDTLEPTGGRVIARSGCLHLEDWREYEAAVERAGAERHASLMKYGRTVQAVTKLAADLKTFGIHAIPVGNTLRFNDPADVDELSNKVHGA